MSIDLPRTSQAELLATGGLEARLKLKAGGNVRVSAILEAGGRSLRLGPRRETLLFPRRWRTVSLPLDRRGRAAL
ncbi:MAG TPA: hypothetical protein VJT75_02315, partial [Thermoleophilaceae bacterium]|nr:hypothetical protein [Thermoleophilaceae bacterium]